MLLVCCPIETSASVLTVGEREFVKDNKSLGNFRLDGIPPAPRGVPQVEVKFDIDANGILSVTATDKGTQKKQDIKITGASTLNSDEVDRMVQEAEKFSAEDKVKREAIETKNKVFSYYHFSVHKLNGFKSALHRTFVQCLHWPMCTCSTLNQVHALTCIEKQSVLTFIIWVQADSAAYEAEKQLKEFGDKVPADVKEKVEAKIKSLREAVASDNTESMKTEMEALQQELMAVGQAMYSQSGGADAGAAGPGGAPGADKKDGGDNVVDAEFTDTDK